MESQFLVLVNGLKFAAISIYFDIPIASDLYI